MTPTPQLDPAPNGGAVPREGASRPTWRTALAVVAVVIATAIATGWWDLGAFPAAFLAKLFLLVFIGSAVLLVGGARLFGRTRARVFYFGALVVCIVTLLSLVAGEFVVRYLFRDVSTTSDNNSYFAHRWWAAHPPAENSLGFREREFTAVPAPDVLRVAIVGDSFTYGQGILDDARVSNLLEQRLNQRADGTQHVFEVLNFGIPGAETVDEQQTLEQHVLPSRPDFVILQWYVNDIDDRTTPGRPPPGLLPSATLERFLAPRSALYYLVKVERDKARRAYYHTRNSVELRFLEPDGVYANHYRQILERFIRTVQANGTPLAMVVYPELADANGDPKAYPKREVIDAALKICAAARIACLDVREVFAAVTPATRLWASRLDSHPGLFANELVTDRLMELLRPDLQRLADAKSAAGVAPSPPPTPPSENASSLSEPEAT